MISRPEHVFFKGQSGREIIIQLSARLFGGVETPPFRRTHLNVARIVDLSCVARYVRRSRCSFSNFRFT